MTLLTAPVVFGAVVRYRDDGLHYLVVGWRDETKTIACCARPDGRERLIHVHWLTVLRWPRRFVPHGRRNASR